MTGWGGRISNLRMPVPKSRRNHRVFNGLALDAEQKAAAVQETLIEAAE